MELGSSVVKRVAKEVQTLVQKPMEDIQVVPNDHDLRDIQAWIRGPGKNHLLGGFSNHCALMRPTRDMRVTYCPNGCPFASGHAL